MKLSLSILEHPNGCDCRKCSDADIKLKSIGIQWVKLTYPQFYNWYERRDNVDIE